MKISSLELTNFRQFYGEQTLTLSTDETKNVTVVHAENGVGKTTLLNAILWCFFGDTTAKFEQKDKIVNFTAFDEGTREASVAVNFRHNDTDYRVVRRINEKTGAYNLVAQRVDGGKYKALSAEETFVNSVVPRGMARYFFFDGEAAEQFSSENNSKDVGRAIRLMLGCDLAETAIGDLKSISRELDTALSNLPGDAALQDLEAKLSQCRQLQDESKAHLTKAEDERRTYSMQKEEIAARLRELEGAAHLQKQRDLIDSQLIQAKRNEKETQSRIVDWVGKKALWMVGRQLGNTVLALVKDAKLERRIPSPYNEEFVQGLLNAQSCVCHRPLEAGSPEWKAVAALLHDAGNAEITKRLLRIRASSQIMPSTRADAQSLLQEMQERLGRESQNRRTLEQKLAEISEKLRGAAITEIAQREEARRRLERQIQDLDQKIGQLKQRLLNLENQERKFEKDLDEEAARNSRSLKILRKKQLINKSRAFLEKALESYEIEARDAVKAKVDSILSHVARRDYLCRLNDDFSLELTYRDGRSTPKSGGENQLLSLGFIGALVDFARRRISDDRFLLRPGTTAPLILDSPMGQLDSLYRVQTAEFLPKMAPQVVLFLSSSQGDQTVLDALQPVIGAQYVLISENKGPRRGSDDRLSINGKEIACSLYDRERTMTRIEKIR